MVLKQCVVCGKSFNAKGSAKTCSVECSKERKKQIRKYKKKVKKCIICGKEFSIRGTAKVCSVVRKEKDEYKKVKKKLENVWFVEKKLL